MRLDLIFDEIFSVLSGAGIGLNVPADGPGVRGGIPAPYLELPEITYGEAGRGMDRLTDVGLVILVGRANNADSYRDALEYASSGGPKSVKILLEAHTWTTCGTVFVRSGEPSIETEQGGNPLLAYTFHIDITGRPG